MKNKFLHLCLCVAIAAGVAGCKKVDLTTDPNNPSDANAATMLPGVEAATVFMHEGQMARCAGMWSRTFTGSDRQYISYHNYNVTAGDFDNEWSAVYASTIAQARLLRSKALTENKKGIAGIAFLIEAHAAGTAADLWGDIPFSEAGDVEKYPQPHYDKQADVYASAQALLDSALKYLPTSGSTLTTRANNWAQIAHSLKARNYLHVGNYAMAASEAAQGILDPANNWVAVHADTDPTTWNIYYQFIDYQRGGYMTATDAIAYQLLDSSDPMYRGNSKTIEDARRDFYYLAPGGYAAIDPNFDGGMFDYTAEFPLVTAQEMHLILAEVEARNGQDSNAVAHINHVRAMHRDSYADSAYVDYAVADFETGGLAAMSGMTRNESIMYEIFEEKYLSLYGQIEVFTDLRRKGNSFRSVISPVTGASIPERFPYPQSEINSNTNIPKPQPSIFTKTPVNQ